MSWIIRQMRVPEDYERVAELLTTWQSDPVTVDRLKAEDAIIPVKGQLKQNDNNELCGYDRIRWVVVKEESGEACGFAVVVRAGWDAPGDLFLTVVVHPAETGQGAGQALYRTAEQWAESVSGSLFKLSVREEDQRAVAFAQKRGFTIGRRTFESKLDVAAYKGPSSVDKRHALEKEGIIFCSLQELPGEEEERKLYALCQQTQPDIPGFSGKPPMYEWWRKWTLEADGAAPELILLACHGERIIGMVQLLWNKSFLSMYHEYTCVDREYRGRGIALVLKLMAIEKAREWKAAHLRTHNDSMNGPMLHINRDVLGFQAEPGFYWMEKNLRP
ncbi:GNAT family N-acetyltransferase [Paenibacillus mesotrionivorans]|uniref:GNAT family N-acetyltransferase n=1 Tax=Paenibacillus mesotrionivorans TaxID=3160968 RepID=A0ACC7P6F0_9BACL